MNCMCRPIKKQGRSKNTAWPWWQPIPQLSELSPNLCLLPKKTLRNLQPFRHQIQKNSLKMMRLPALGQARKHPVRTHVEFRVDHPFDVNNNKVSEHKFNSTPPIKYGIQEDDNPELKSLSTLGNATDDEDLGVSLRLGDREPKWQISEPPK